MMSEKPSARRNYVFCALKKEGYNIQVSWFEDDDWYLFDLDFIIQLYKAEHHKDGSKKPEASDSIVEATDAPVLTDGATSYPEMAGQGDLFHFDGEPPPIFEANPCGLDSEDGTEHTVKKPSVAPEAVAPEISKALPESISKEVVPQNDAPVERQHRPCSQSKSAYAEEVVDDDKPADSSMEPRKLTWAELLARHT